MKKNLQAFSYTVGSIIGTGALMIPLLIYNSGASSILSLIISTILFTGLAYLFLQTNNIFYDLKNSINNIYLYKFIATSYWITTWTGTIIGIYEMATAFLSLTQFEISGINILITQFFIISAFIIIQKFGFNSIGKFEVVITILKIFIVTSLPIIIILYSLQQKLTVDCTITKKSVISLLPTMMWMFLGIESCTIISKESKNFSPIFIALIVVFIIYLLNITAAILIMDSTINLSFPYSDIIKKVGVSFLGPLYCKQLSIFVSLIIIFLCASSTNSWYVMSASTLRELDYIIPKKFNKTYFSSVLWSSIGLFPLSFILSSPDAKKVFLIFLDYFSILSIIFYCLCAYSVTKIHKKFFVGIPVIISLLYLIGSIIYRLLT